MTTINKMRVCDACGNEPGVWMHGSGASLGDDCVPEGATELVMVEIIRMAADKKRRRT